MEAVLSAMRERGLAEAWAAYRADWEPVLVFFHEHGFLPTRLMINYVAELSRLPRAAVPEGWVVAPMERGDLAEIRAMGAGILLGGELREPGGILLGQRVFRAGEPVRREGRGGRQDPRGRAGDR